MGPNNGNASFGYSDWIGWQSDSGKLLHDLVDNSIISDDFSGKYRIESYGQLFFIGFNDANLSRVELFQYIGDYKDYSTDRLVKIDTSLDVVEYDCWLRHYIYINGYEHFADKCTEKNKAHVLLSKIDDKTYNYTLTVANKTVIDVVMKNHANEPKMPELEKEYSWFPSSFAELEGDGRISFDIKNKVVHITTRDLLSGSWPFCFEGFSLRSVDEENKKISFWLEDREQSDFADYFEIHITKEDWTDEPKRGADKDNKRLMKGTLGFYKEGNSTPICFYDEEHSEFSRRIGYDGCDE